MNYTSYSLVRLVRSRFALASASPFRLFACVSPVTFVAALLLAIGPVSFAADSGTGSVSGRVINVNTGRYLNNARVTVVGTDQVAFTNSFGEYRLTGVPAGEATIRVFYTGLDSQEFTVSVAAGEETRQNARMTSRARYGETVSDDDVIELDQYLIEETRETDANAIALNEQRFAPNLMNVVSADAFGDVTEGNIGEFVKFLPGVSVEYVAADVRTINVRGFADNFTAVSVDGAQMASAASSGTSRAFELEQVSLNNVSRIEVSKVPTPAMPANSLGGSVNLVSKSAFEQDRSSLKYKAYLSINSEDLKVFSKTPGPGDRDTYKVLPGFDVSYVNPVSDRFGFVVNLLSSNQFNEQHRSQTEWDGIATGVTPENPYMRRYTLQDGPKNTYRDSISLRGDWKVGENHVFSAGYQFNYYKAFFGNRNITLDTGTNPVTNVAGGADREYGPTFTHGASGRGSGGIGTSFRDKLGATNAFNANWRFTNREWEIDASFSTSNSRNWYRDINRDHFDTTLFELQPRGSLTVHLDDIDNIKIGSYTVIDETTGAVVDPTDISNWWIREIRSRPMDSSDWIDVYQLSAERSFGGFSVEGGLLHSRQTRDIRRLDNRWLFVGADGEQRSPDDVATPVLDTVYADQDPYWGVYDSIQWPSPFELWELYESNPEYFESQDASNFVRNVGNSYFFSENITAAYLQADTRTMEGKLRILGGIRYEETDTEALGALHEPSRAWQTDGSGNFVLDEDGDPVRRPEFGEDGSLQDEIMTRVERGAVGQKEYDGIYPSVHFTYDVSENVVARLSYAKSLGRPNLSDILPNTTINASEDPSDDPPGTISVRNTGLEPWEADNYDISLDYYTNTGGSISGSFFVKNIDNFFGSLVIPSATLEDLEPYGLAESQYVGYQISTRINTGKARVTGGEFSVSQGLGFMGGLGEAFTVYANYTKLNLSGANEADFSRFIPEVVNIGLSYNRRPFNVQLKWNYRGDQRRGTQNGVAPMGFEYYDSRYNLDLNVEYKLSERLAVFANGRNITNQEQVLQRYGPDMPEYAHNYRTERFGVQWALGVKGSF